ncbi:unnamed protein product [Ilex paraguariensis]|uniref:Uncharacterized protein n=1 Tax=Ilex paraguariensis TaxID=185542 RepID=A0ABC8SEP7_9AQUA
MDSWFSWPLCSTALTGVSFIDWTVSGRVSPSAGFFVGLENSSYSWNLMLQLDSFKAAQGTVHATVHV